VIDALHVVNAGAIPVRFYVDRRNEQPGGVELTDDFFRLKEALQFPNLPAEVESRLAPGRNCFGTATSLANAT